MAVLTDWGALARYDRSGPGSETAQAMNYESPLTTDEQAAVDAEPSSVSETDGFPRRKLIVYGAIILALVVLIAYFTHRSSGDGLGDSASRLPLVSVMVPGKATVAGSITASGTLAARRELPVGVVGDGGRVVRVPVEPGQWVKRGQVLAVIDSSVQNQQIASAAAQVSAANADAQLAQSNLDRALQLVERGFISKAEIDRLTATRDGGVARVGVARAQLAELRAKAARLNIVAPDAGLLLTREVEPGQVVTGGPNVLFSIAKGGEMELLAQLGEEDLAKVHVGATATVTPTGSDKSYSGQVWQVSPVIDLQTRQGRVRVALSYEPGLRPGGFASATIQSGTVVAPMLPESAIQTDERGSYVYVVGKDNKVLRRDVKTGFVTKQGIAVVNGLTGNERIVARAAAFLSPGDKVRPNPVKSSGK